MLTEDELAALESLLARARAAAGQARSESGGTVNVGDLVQLRPGADSHWQTSLLLVCKIRDNGHISGIVLRPHRGGVSLAHYTYSLPEVLRVGTPPFPPPDRAVNSAGYLAWCPKCLGRDGSESPPVPAVTEALAEGQQDGGEIQIGPRLWWAVVSEPKPKTRKKKPAIVEVQQTIEEIQHAIEGLPRQDDGALPEPKPKPIQRETRGQKQPVLVHQLEQVRQLVLDAVGFWTKSSYGRAMTEFLTWWEQEGRPDLTRATVQNYRVHLEASGRAPSSITTRLSAVRKLAKLAAKAGLFEPAFGKGPRPSVDEMDERDALWDTYIRAALTHGRPTTKCAFAMQHHVNPREFSRWRARDGMRWIATGSTLDLRIRSALALAPADAAQGPLAEDQQLPGTPLPEPKPMQRETESVGVGRGCHAARIRKILGGAK